MINLEEIIKEATGSDLGDMWRTRPYDGQPHTNTGTRGKTEIKGITFRDLRDCFIRATFMAANDQRPDLYEEALKGERGYIAEDALFSIDWNKLDPMALLQNLSCEIERLMAIYPNVPKLECDNNDDSQ